MWEIENDPDLVLIGTGNNVPEKESNENEESTEIDEQDDQQEENESERENETSAKEEEEDANHDSSLKPLSSDLASASIIRQKKKESSKRTKDSTRAEQLPSKLEESSRRVSEILQSSFIA
jgi:hypothetical protein